MFKKVADEEKRSNPNHFFLNQKLFGSMYTKKKKKAKMNFNKHQITLHQP